MNKNILEKILSHYLQMILALRFDICTCNKCREQMMKHLLSKFEPVYVDENDINTRLVEQEVTKKYWQIIFEEITNAIDIVNKNLPHPLEENKEKAYENLLVKIKEDRGVDFSRYHAPLLKRRLALRLVATKTNSYNKYLKILANDPSEYERLFEALTINVSEFFRDMSVWNTIKIVLERVIEESNSCGEAINIWSAGCAGGEEPYSLAILCREIGEIKVPFKIYATDIDEGAIAIAKKGEYDADRINKTQNVLKNFFSFDMRNHFSLKNDKYYVKDEVKKVIEFKYLDLTSSEFIPNANFIMCRNVFIYFTKPLQEQIVDKFYHALRSKGYLIIGKNETLVPEARLVFKEEDLYNKIYQKVKL